MLYNLQYGRGYSTNKFAIVIYLIFYIWVIAQFCWGGVALLTLISPNHYHIHHWWALCVLTIQQKTNVLSIKLVFSPDRFCYENSGNQTWFIKSSLVLFGFALSLVISAYFNTFDGETIVNFHIFHISIHGIHGAIAWNARPLWSRTILRRLTCCHLDSMSFCLIMSLVFQHVLQCGAPQWCLMV